MCMQIIDNGGKEMTSEVAMVYLMKIKQLTHDNAIAWHEWCDYNHGVENYYYQNDEDKYYALLTLQSDCNGEKFQLYIEDDKANWFVFDDKFNPVLADIYNWMTVIIDNDSQSTIIDAEFTEVNDKTPFELVVNRNYNFEILG